MSRLHYNSYEAFVVSDVLNFVASRRIHRSMAVMDDHETLEIKGAGTWSELAVAHTCLCDFNQSSLSLHV